MIHGTRPIAAVKARPGERPCGRCGMLRPARKNSALCADCRAVLTPAERALWRPAA